MSRFVILLGGDLVRTPRARRAGRRRARHRRRQRHRATPRRSASRRNCGSAISIPCRRAARRHGRTCRARSFPAGQGQDRRRTGRRRGARPRRDLAGAGRRLRRPARRPRLPASGAGAAAGRGGMPTLLTSGAQEGIPLLPGARGFDYARRHAVQRPRLLRSVRPVGARRANGRSTASRCRSARRSPSPTRCTGELDIALGSGRALLLAHPYPADPNSDDGTAAPQARRHQADLRRHAAARRRRAVGVCRATGSRWSAATAPASRRC